MFQFSEDLGGNQFFRFPKKWVKNMNWALLPLASKAVFPVIYSHDNGKGQAWPSENTIGALSGLSRKTARKGVDGLLTLAGFSFDWQMTREGRKSKRFKFQTPGQADPVFFFHKIILTGGNWRLLKPISKAVYPVLRCFAAWDKDAEELEDISNKDDDYKEAFAAREWEYSEIQAGDIATYAGITRQNVYPALDDLAKHFLLEKDPAGRWKVFLKPPRYYKRDLLNGQLLKSFGHELREADE